MYNSGFQEFAAHLQDILNDPWNFPETSSYVRLDQLSEVNCSMLNNDANNLPQADPLIDAFNLIIDQAQNLYIDHITFGINEIFKAYLKKINDKNQNPLTSRVLECLDLVFLFVTKESFPYTEKIWETISSMAKPVGTYLIQNRLAPASSLFLEFMAGLGRQAARKGLSTGTLQRDFRIWELMARDCGAADIESRLRNLRQNLEN